ncbi:hypothetical protein MJO52_17565 [Microbulbifer variabilis]|uniref:Uncharacterized protein n=1 Tax=Microbulbifer variabilis TaxID=266805 RepID=A0ABY4V9A7_9GAMM|nr:hypothetical protein [Microbulbifer variabilis]USD20848.1 hypothetical protein MJO52_17565 [Microbulbifer variabilis]
MDSEVREPKIEQATSDRGNQGKKVAEGAKIVLPKPMKKKIIPTSEKRNGKRVGVERQLSR